MPDPARITIIPLGAVDLAEVEAATKRAAKSLGIEILTAKPVPMPVGHFEAARGQSDARKVLAAVPATAIPRPKPAPGTTADPTATKAAQLSPMEAWGSRVHGPASPSPVPTAPKGPIPPVKIGVTDADIYYGLKDFVYVIAEPEQRRALVSVRRIKEAFWKRKSDPPRQQTRLVKELIGAIALAHGAPPCENPTCPTSAARGPLDIDQKGDRLCPNCERKVKGGALKL